ncbi:MAG: thioredoxin domain-containing protein [Phycisphaerales bacterium]|nr:thioredoxin domain-containing protein [Phycisphaerales bacterium]
MTDTMQQERVPTPHFVGGFLLLVFAVAMTLILVMDHFGGLSLPGCGETGGCADVARSWWGKVPGTTWPVSFVGLAYFSGLFIAWLTCRNGIPAAFRYLVRLGALFSVMFCVVMLVKQTLCLYCLGTHIANLGFLIVVETIRRKPSSSLRPLIATAALFVISSGILLVFERRESQQALAKLDKEIDQSTEEIIQAIEKNSETKQTKDATKPDPNKTTIPEPPPSKDTMVKEATPPTEVARNPSDASTQDDSSGFTGRFRMGPEKAAIRIVMLTDYQCPDCRAVEMKARELLETRDDVSLSIKHFPMDKACNVQLSRSLHGNACWAARAAETAGILRGDEGFFEMHHWLFDNKGEFTDKTFPGSLRQMGYDSNEFIRTMMSPLTLELVQADIEEGRSLGLRFTPMIFVNGVQLRGIFEANAHRLIQTVNKIAAKNPPPMTSAADRPPNEVEKYIGDWKASYVRRLPPDSKPWARGPANAKMKIVVWGDFQEKWTVKADRAIVQWMEDKPDVQYSFRHFPFQQECNAVLKIPTIHPKACMASQAAEAAGLLGGLEGYWKMHNWLMDHQKDLSEESLRQAAVDFSFDADDLFAKMSGPDVAGAIEEDCRAAKRSRETKNTLLWRGGIPTIFINGKNVPWWRNNNEVLLDKILEEAYSG